jgi:hypothetical protein
MKILLISAAVWVVGSSLLFAHIGDDEKKIEAIYGKPAKVLDDKGSVKKVGYAPGVMAVVVDFVNGISRREGFTKADTSLLKDEEIKQILNISAADNTTWKEAPAKEGDKRWQRSDGKAEAFLPARGTFLVVQDPTYVPQE